MSTHGHLRAPLLVGLRPFFLGGAIWTAVAMTGWGGLLLGWWPPPAGLASVNWHAHELLFGYATAVVAGFLLTAVPSWTGRAPVTGWSLLALVLLWLGARGCIAAAGVLGVRTALALALIFPVVLLGVVAREILAAGNRRNFVVVGLLAVLVAAQVIFLVEVDTGTPVRGQRLGLAALVMLVLLIGGRITPAFSRNWLRARGDPGEPRSSKALDTLTLVSAALALAGWVLVVEGSGIVGALGGLALLAGVLQWFRQVRWSPLAVRSEPLLLVLHAGQAFAGAGFVALGTGLLLELPRIAAAATHLWSIGAVGLMTLGVMTRATRGHTGRALRAPPATTALFLLVILAAVARLGASVVETGVPLLLGAAAVAWVLAFAGFVLLHAAMLVGPSLGDGPP